MKNLLWIGQFYWFWEWRRCLFRFPARSEKGTELEDGSSSLRSDRLLHFPKLTK
jgi:hypothetical protein